MDALSIAQRTLLVLLPEFLILATAIVMMTAGAFVRLPRRVWALAAAGGLVAALVALVALRGTGTAEILHGAVVLNDALAGYTRLGFLVTGLLLLAMAHDQVDDARAAEFFGALLMVHAGAMLVATANDLVFLFVGLELVSIPTYLLLYLPRRNRLTQEAATKYFYLSVFSSGLLLFGLAYLYGLTGVSNLKALGYILQNAPTAAPRSFGLIAALFIVAGLGFRVAAVPFHFYAPDVYQGSPTIIAALLAWVPKGVGFVAMIRVLTAVMGGANPMTDRVVLLAWVVAVATLTLGNTVALWQDDLKRLLAYSSIAHAGYLMIGVAAALRNGPADAPAYLGTQGIIFYLAAYGLMTLGAFGVILALHTPERPVERVDDLNGLSQTRPLAALALALCLFSLAGVPPLAGFWGKYYVFAAALSAGGPADTRMFQVLTVIGVLNAAIGAYYYLRLIVAMYLRPPVGEPVAPRAGLTTSLAVGACAFLSLALGFFPNPIARASREAAVAATAQPPAPPAEAPAITAVP
jgi:NADH-quinone oxidoreductase subunit N